jgi:FkbM family methyltransferase
VIRHPIFEKFKWNTPSRDDTFSVFSIGARERHSFVGKLIPNYLPFQNETPAPQHDATAAPAPTLSVKPDSSPVSAPAPIDLEGALHPDVNEEYFEWIDVLTAVDNYASSKESDRPFVFFELGAGYGRWSVFAICALRRRRGNPWFRIVAAEADPDHFAWLSQNLDDNAVPADSRILYQAPVTGNDRPVHFHTGDSANWYGQAVVADEYVASLIAEPIWQERNNAYVASSPNLSGLDTDPSKRRIVPMKSVKLSDMVAHAGNLIDLIDLDIQGSEGEVIEEAEPILRQHALRLHIATHSIENEALLKKVLTGRNWTLEQNYACLGSRSTPFGEVAFGDGVQSWVNTRLARM